MKYLIFVCALLFSFSMNAQKLKRGGFTSPDTNLETSLPTRNVEINANNFRLAVDSLEAYSRITNYLGAGLYFFTFSDEFQGPALRTADSRRYIGLNEDYAGLGWGVSPNALAVGEGFSMRATQDSVSEAYSNSGNNSFGRSYTPNSWYWVKRKPFYFQKIMEIENSAGTHPIVVGNNAYRLPVTAPATDSSVLVFIDSAGVKRGNFLPYPSACDTCYLPIGGGSLNRTDGNGYLGLPNQSVNPLAPSSGLRVYSNSSTDLKFRSSDNQGLYTFNFPVYPAPSTSYDVAFPAVSGHKLAYMSTTASSSLITKMDNNGLLTGATNLYSDGTRVSFNTSFTRGGFTARGIASTSTNGAAVSAGQSSHDYNVSGNAGGSFFTSESSGFPAGLFHIGNITFRYPNTMPFWQGFATNVGSVGLIAGGSASGLRASAGVLGYANTSSATLTANRAAAGVFWAEPASADTSTGPLYGTYNYVTFSTGLNPARSGYASFNQVVNTKSNQTAYGGWFSSSGSGVNYGVYSAAGKNVFVDSTQVGLLRVQKILASGSSPTILVNSNAGTGGSASMSSNSKDVSGTISITSGSTSLSAGLWATITFSSAYAVAPTVVITASGRLDDTAGQNAASAIDAFYVKETTTGFEIWATDAIIAAINSRFDYNYIIIGQ